MQALLASSAVCLVLGAVGGWKIAEWREGAQEAKQVVHTVYVTKAQGDVSTVAAAKDAAAQTVIKWRTQTVIKEVPTYVSAQTDSAFPLPWGLVRVHDAAAAGVDVSALPDTAYGPDGSASTVAASRAAEVISGNYGACLANAERLSALQGWISAQAAAFTTK